MRETLLVGGVAVPVRIRRHARARRVSLRVDPADRSVVLVLPPRAPLGHAMEFARSRLDWLSARLAAVPGPIPFADGTVIPLLGQDHLLRHVPDQRGGVWVDGTTVQVAGRAEHFPRRVRDWLRKRAQEEILARARPMAEQIGREIAVIRLGDPRSRWGSCNSRGILAFSWRLILSPAEILTYVVAHEVAHLAEMNHSPAFWRVVDQLVPDAGDARAWLKRHGTGLHRYG